MKAWKVSIALSFLILVGILAYPYYEDYQEAQYQKWLDSLPEYDPAWRQVILTVYMTIGNKTYPLEMTTWTGPDICRTKLEITDLSQFLYLYNSTTVSEDPNAEAVKKGVVK